MHTTDLLKIGLLVLVAAGHSLGEIIPPNRIITWQGKWLASLGASRIAPTIYQTIPAGASLATVQNAVNNCPANQVIDLSAGNYSWDGTLDWRRSDVVLRGAGPSKTIITFTDGFSTHLHADRFSTNHR